MWTIDVTSILRHGPLSSTACGLTLVVFLTQHQHQHQHQRPNTPTPTLNLTLPSPLDPHQAGDDFSALSAAADAGVLSDAPPPNTLTEDDLQKEIAKAVQNVEGVSDADKEKVTLAPTLTQPQP